MTVSYWQSALGPAPTYPPLPGDRTVDVAIVGGGYTGLWTAYYLALADPTLRVAVLEASYIGFGASGRNGGWCSGLFPVSLRALARRHGQDAAVAMYQALADTVDEVGRIAHAEGIGCDFAKGGTISLARNVAQLRRARSAHGLDEKFLDADRARAVCGATGTGSSWPGGRRSATTGT